MQYDRIHNVMASLLPILTVNDAAVTDVVNSAFMGEIRSRQPRPETQHGGAD